MKKLLVMIAAVTAFTIVLSGVALGQQSAQDQGAGQNISHAGGDLKAAGDATGSAAKHVGHATVKTSKTGARKVKNASKSVLHKGAHATKNAADHVENKTGDNKQ